MEICNEPSGYGCNAIEILHISITRSWYATCEDMTQNETDWDTRVLHPCSKIYKHSIPFHYACQIMNIWCKPPFNNHVGPPLLRSTWIACSPGRGGAVHRGGRIGASPISRQIDLFHIINELCRTSTCQARPTRVNNERKLDVGESGLSDSVALTIQYIRTNVRRP